MTDKFRERVKKMDEKKALERQNLAQELREKGKRSYVDRVELTYPFLTFENDIYCEFMTSLMFSLEMRYFKQGEMITQELSECSEVIFVCKGRYNIGYEINKRKCYRKQTGPSSIIGLFNICFQKRFLFNMKAHSFMDCLGIRRQKWKSVVEKFPQFHRVMKQKSFTFYFGQIYRPLMKCKDQDIQFYK